MDKGSEMIKNAILNITPAKEMFPHEHRIGLDLSLLEGSCFEFFLTGSRYFNRVHDQSHACIDYDFFTSSVLSAEKEQWLVRHGYISMPNSNYKDMTIGKHFRKTTKTTDGRNVNIDVAILKSPKDHIRKEKVQRAIAGNSVLSTLMTELDKKERCLLWDSLLSISDIDGFEVKKRLIFA